MIWLRWLFFALICAFAVYIMGRLVWIGFLVLLRGG